MFLFFEANIQQFLAIKDHILEKKKEKQILFDDNYFHYFYWLHIEFHH